MNSPSNTQTPGALLQRYMRLIEVTRDLSSTLELDVLLHSIVDAAADVTDSGAASILLYDESKNELYFEASTNLDAYNMRGLVVPVEGSIAGEIVQTRQPLIVMRVSEDPRHYQEIGESTQYTTESLLGVPMIVNDKVIGVLEALNKTGGDFGPADQQLLAALGSQAAIAIQNSRLFQQSDLIAEMVHELRTPLASINTAAHLLMHAEIPQDQRATMAQTIQRETGRLSEMATSFLDLARLESGRSQFKVDQVDLAQVIEEATEVMRSRASEQGLTLELKIEKPLPIFTGDADKLKQVVLNLISNAIKYNSPNGSITVLAASDEQSLTLSVADTGRGMLPEHIELLFQKFYRVPGSEQIAQGTGLGLSITKKIVEGHGGEIKVESEIDKGTSFIITIPR